MAKKSIKDVDLSGKRCFVRVDFNVPLDEKDGQMVITDETRIKETIPTLTYLLEKKAKIILASHLGRPKGKVDPKQSLKPVASRLSEILNVPVDFSSDCVGAEALAKAKALQPGGILLLENVRFHAEEEKNNPEFAKQLAELAEVYVNDAFGSAHRAHASTEGVAHFVPVAVSGFLMQKELQFLGEETSNPTRPFVVILGGAKVSDKINVIDALLDKANTILIGGAMAYTFSLALGKKIGSSLSESDKVEIAKAALEKAKAKGVKFLVPVDHIITEKVDFAAKTMTPTKITEGIDIPDGWQGVDIGPKTVELYSAEVASAKTILWNGPMGIFEIKDSNKGTFTVAEKVAANSGAKSIIGGGDSVKAVKKAGVASKVTFISTGGGASLEFLEGKALPGVTALNDL